MTANMHKLFVFTLSLLILFPTISAAENSEGESLGLEKDADSHSTSTTESETAAATQANSGSGPVGQLSKLQIHGFLTQAYVDANFQEGRFPQPDGSPSPPNAEEILLGIPEGGTTGYRTMAIQFRYDMTPKDVIIFQFSSRVLGESPISQIEDDLEVDWAFYERRLGDYSSIKVGKVQIPYGIFNEYRDVGTLLPFFRPSYNFYREGAFVSETVDGINFSHVFAAETDWNLEFDIYWGEWDDFDFDPFTNEARSSRNEDAGGVQLWLSTPVSGLRFGAGFQRFDTTGGAEGILRPVGGKTGFETWHTSVEGVFEKFVARAEYQYRDAEPAPTPFVQSNDFQGTFPTYYLQFGYLPSPSWSIYAQYESTKAELTSSNFLDTVDYTQREDLGIAVNYSFTPSAVIKLEYHEVEGEDFLLLPVNFDPLTFSHLTTPIDDGDYFILSLSASF